VNYKPVPPKAAKIKDAENILSCKVENITSEQKALKSIKCVSEYDMKGYSDNMLLFWYTEFRP